MNPGEGVRSSGLGQPPRGPAACAPRADMCAATETHVYRKHTAAYEQWLPDGRSRVECPAAVMFRRPTRTLLYGNGAEHAQPTRLTTGGC
ncbi:hypothetical protein NDU88_010520 [Pleurodeles waltl]|uniref:Uncharacterized protein n=1 Tax=Pleurodeles waltl TaxID=8319 RepID=A0AAV7Q270_PLEWA|nr:hypothetical protein NDU88_010520 [Pleurodeles waltl]